MNRDRTHRDTLGRPSELLPTPPAAALPFGGHLIRFVRCQFETEAKCQAAFVVIEPPTKLPSPDIVLGYGREESEARNDAFARAQARIANHWLNCEWRSADCSWTQWEPLSGLARKERTI
jgi:hypothetical protein